MSVKINNYFLIIFFYVFTRKHTGKEVLITEKGIFFNKDNDILLIYFLSALQAIFFQIQKKKQHTHIFISHYLKLKIDAILKFWGHWKQKKNCI